VEVQEEESIKPSLFIWNIAPPKAPSIDLMFRSSGQIPSLISMENPAPWNNPTASLAGNPDADETVHIRILYKYLARRD
jgi:hypothetical protein